MPRLRAHHPRLPSGSAGMPACKLSCSTKPRHEQRLVCSRMAKPKATVIRGKPSPAGWPPCPAVPRDPSVWDSGVSPSRRLLTSFCCREGLPVGLVQRIAGWFGRDGFASFQTLRCPPYLCPEICERVCAYVCVRLELSGIFHAGHAFPCLQPFPTSPQAGRQTCLHWNRPPRRPPARRSLLSRRGAARALQQQPRHSAKFLSSLISRVLCVCAHAHCVSLFFFFFFFFLPRPAPALPDG